MTLGEGGFGGKWPLVRGIFWEKQTLAKGDLAQNVTLPAAHLCIWDLVLPSTVIAWD